MRFGYQRHRARRMNTCALCMSSCGRGWPRIQAAEKHTSFLPPSEVPRLRQSLPPHRHDWFLRCPHNPTFASPHQPPRRPPSQTPSSPSPNPHFPNRSTPPSDCRYSIGRYIPSSLSRLPHFHPPKTSPPRHTPPTPLHPSFPFDPTTHPQNDTLQAFHNCNRFKKFHFLQCRPSPNDARPLCPTFP
jgi:hypothetical protein